MMKPLQILAVTGILVVASFPASAQTDLPVGTLSAGVTGAVSERLTDGSPRADQPKQDVQAAGDGFLETVAGDFRRFFTPRNSGLAMVLAPMAFVASNWDSAAAVRMHNPSSSAYATGNFAGGLWVHVGAGAGALMVGKVANQPAAVQLGSELLRAQLVSQTLVQGLKRAADRSRPDHSNQLSFPSGHTASTFATASVLEQRFGWKVGVPAYALGALVAASRMGSSKHYLSDVILGAAIGVGAGRAVTVGGGRAKFDLGVAPTDGGAAVTFTKKN
jgi:membrane-associated phospholipid phosphatase